MVTGCKINIGSRLNCSDQRDGISKFCRDFLGNYFMGGFAKSIQATTSNIPTMMVVNEAIKIVVTKGLSDVHVELQSHYQLMCKVQAPTRSVRDLLSKFNHLIDQFTRFWVPFCSRDANLTFAILAEQATNVERLSSIFFYLLLLSIMYYIAMYVLCTGG